jgi:hypothetical protein
LRRLLAGAHKIRSIDLFQPLQTAGIQVAALERDASDFYGA